MMGCGHHKGAVRASDSPVADRYKFPPHELTHRPTLQTSLHNMKSLSDIVCKLNTLAVSESKHCVRCHRTYRDHENVPDACIVYHLPHYYHPNCAAMVKGILVCFHGLHTTNTEEVEYNFDSVSQCSGRCHYSS
ncbi:uncharacterized protein LAESUDRAFT_516812 [Laetiporus sulphureus 93-53]|uniref:Uncharacterized protein n=1 Tax=Laetiporus sulphureus 93-53 TaxID=1314785 RepID=A0A165G188_9APHY|nr:uncharacterized protein LAESUDRAFT_516812 [Laetiporus sulphureus 93-53]KZT09693.1 hypothetical protein LAESUDRAFT_516812 [Laetiporus sulphureus 93-53]